MIKGVIVLRDDLEWLKDCIASLETKLTECEGVGLDRGLKIDTLQGDLVDALRLGEEMAKAITRGEDVDALEAEIEWRDRFGGGE